MRGEGNDSSVPLTEVNQSPVANTQRQGEPHYSGRVVHQLEHFIGLGEVPEDLETNPSNYNEAIQDKDATLWQSAMKTELESMYSNQVWLFVDPPNGVKPIGCKWVYKRKRGVDRKVETFKARLVAKGYTQKEGFDYEETFSLVAMIKSIRILLSIAAHMDYEIWQMNVKTTFLNGSLDETIYMVQPEGFIAKGQEKKVCKLQKSIYALKQVSRS